MSIEKVYSALEKLENGSSLVDIVKGEMAKITEIASEKGRYKSELETANSFINTVKPLTDFVKAEGLDVDKLKEFVSKSREGETALDKMKRDMETLSSKFNSTLKELETERTKKAEIEKTAQQAKLKEVFAEKLSNVNSKFLNNHLDIAIMKGDIRFDENNEPVGNYNGTFMKPADYAEKFKSDNKDFIVGKTGPGSTPGSENSQGGNKYGEMSAHNLAMEAVKALGF